MDCFVLSLQKEVDKLTQLAVLCHDNKQTALYAMKISPNNLHRALDRYAFTKTPEDLRSAGAPKKPPPFRAEQYAKNNKLQRKHNNCVLNFCQPTFLYENTSAMQFLDVGCGTGDYTRDCLLPSCLPCQRIVATDWSSDMIDYARGHFWHEKIKYEVLDIAGSGVADFISLHGLFHRIYSFYCLQWVKTQDAALKNIARLLTPGGECLLLFPASSQPTAAWQILAGMERWAKYSEVLLSVVPESQNMASKQKQLDYMSSLLWDAGLAPTIFAVTRLETFDGSSEEDIIRLHSSIIPIGSLVSEEERQQLQEDLVTLVRKLHGPETDQSLFRMYIIKATKKPER